MTATLEALGERRGQPTAAVVTSDGTAWSWPDLFDQFAPALRSFARSRGASSPDDIVQDVFTTAVERFPQFEGDRSGLRSFLFTLAYRRVADEHRTLYRRQEQLVADHQPTADDRLDIEDAFTTHEEAAEAVRALDILGERERQVIAMRIIDEASPAEVADALGISNGNVRVIQARALIKIRKYLESKSGAMPSISLVFAFLKGLRSELPTDGGLAAWIEMLQSESTRGAVKTAAAGAGSAIAAGTASVAGTVLKIGLVVALATASTSTVEPGVENEASAVVNLVEETEATEFSVPSAVVDEPTPAIGIAPVAPNRPNLVPPSKSGTEKPGAEADQASAKTEVVAEPDVDGSSNAGQVVDPVVGGIVEPEVNEVVESVEEVVNGVVETVETVVETVTTVVEEVVDETVEEVVNTVNTVNNTVETVVDTVDETTNTVTDTVDTVVDDVTSVVGGVTGGLFGR